MTNGHCYYTHNYIGERSEPKYAILLSHTEVQEMTKMLKTSSTDVKFKKQLSQKLNNAEPASKRKTSSTFTDDYEVIEKEDCLPVSSPVHQQFATPPRAFSLDSLKAKWLKKQFVSRSSVPEVTQSCVYLPNGRDQDGSPSRCCTCRGACANFTLPTDKDAKSRKWMSSIDSGMGHSQDSNDSTGNLREADCDQVHQSESMYREGMYNVVCMIEVNSTALYMVVSTCALYIIVLLSLWLLARKGY